MNFSYGEYDGQPFPTPDSLFPQPKVMKLILQYGDKALDAFEQMDENEQLGQLVQEMIDAGLLEETKDAQGNRKLQITPKMLKGLQHKALEEIFTGLQQGHKQGHSTESPGRTTERSEGNKPYEFGDPISELDLGATMRHAIKRQVAEQSTGASPGVVKPALPIRLGMDDFELHQTEGTADVATVMLLDLSGSMMRYGRFYQAKRVALGMQALIRSRFPQDTMDYVGFYSLAEPLKERDVPLVMPKPVSIYDYRVRIRVPLAQAQREPAKIPLHFTNLHMGLRTARQILARRGAANKQIFVVTDGQPTAHIEPGGGGVNEDMLYLLYPPDERTTEVTLQEALRCQQQGIRIATFALIEDYYGMDWVGFVDRLTRLTRGVAYYCTSEDLSSTVIESYLSGKKKKSFVH